jgi:plastocyanin
MTARRMIALSAAALVLWATPASAGEIRGTVDYVGAPPQLVPLKTTKNQDVCGATVPNESVEVSNGHLENVVVTLKGNNLPKPQPARITLDQKNCRYVPHVQATGPGATIEILNDDPMLHNIHGYLGTATVFNLAMPFKGQKIPRVLAKPGVVRVKCDVHEWMSGWIVVSETPFAVVGKDGTYAIKDVPPGTYTLTAWQEKLGEKTQSVTVPATGDATVNFSYGK